VAQFNTDPPAVDGKLGDGHNRFISSFLRSRKLT